MKTPTTGDEWADYHLTCFAITAEDDVKGVFRWAKTFTKSGFPVADLVAATDWMVLNVSPQWRREHLAHIQACLQRFKMGRLSDRKNAAQSPGMVCGSCDDTGFVFVPHPKDITEGVWGGTYEAVVACPCHHGDASVSEFESRKKGLRRLIGYEREFPHWREMVFLKKERVREMAAMQAEAAHADKSAGPLFKKIVERVTEGKV